MGQGLKPFRVAARLLSTMPGISAISALVLIAEIGIDMSRFATPGHLLSWACLCPRNDESVGKRRSTRLRKGGVWLKTTLVQAAWAAVKVKGGYLQAQFHRIRARRGAKKAIIAVAASMLTAAWHRLRDGTEWHDLGAAHFDRADAAKTANRLIRRLQQIGYQVTVVPARRAVVSLLAFVAWLRTVFEGCAAPRRRAPDLGQGRHKPGCGEYVRWRPGCGARKAARTCA